MTLCGPMMRIRVEVLSTSPPWLEATVTKTWDGIARSATGDPTYIEQCIGLWVRQYSLSVKRAADELVL